MELRYNVSMFFASIFSFIPVFDCFVFHPSFGFSLSVLFVLGFTNANLDRIMATSWLREKSRWHITAVSTAPSRTGAALLPVSYKVLLWFLLLWKSGICFFCQFCHHAGMNSGKWYHHLLGNISLVTVTTMHPYLPELNSTRRHLLQAV